MNPRYVLRFEGLAVSIAAIGAYLWLDGPLWLLALLALAPDLSRLGYLRGLRIGSISYNVVHTYALPLGLAGVALVTDSRLALLVTLVWIAHIGVDRLFGYRLKYESGFERTHLSPASATETAVE